MKILIAQLNPVVGDVDGNTSKAEAVLKKHGAEADLVVFPELFITGYPPRDILEKPHFIVRVEKALDKIKELSRSCRAGILIGSPTKCERAKACALHNSAVLIHDGRILLKQRKSLLPTYDVFDEARYFGLAEEVKTVSFKGETLGVSICEDMWASPKGAGGRKYSFDPVNELARKGATMLINISASPFYAGKESERALVIKNHAMKYKLPFIFVNQVGANDELVFDGKSMFVDADGDVIDALAGFKEDIKLIDTKSSAKYGSAHKVQDELESVRDALVLGTRDYMKKCGFKKCVIGLSGGIDSSLAACIAKEAVGGKNVLGVFMPSRYTSKESGAYAKSLADNLNIEFMNTSIKDIYSAYLKSLKRPLKLGSDISVTEQNIQARIRGNILMAISNKYGHLVLSTGNKSELAMGYCTLYGDMSGGLAVISDVPKTMVYKLAELINKTREIIPLPVIKRDPTAELKPNQKDRDTLPPYEVLDKILFHYIDIGMSAEEIIRLGFKPDLVKRIIRIVRINEYKRRQAAPGIKVTTKSFGVGRRLPLAGNYE